MGSTLSFPDLGPVNTFFDNIQDDPVAPMVGGWMTYMHRREKDQSLTQFYNNMKKPKVGQKIYLLLIDDEEYKDIDQISAYVKLFFELDVVVVTHIVKTTSTYIEDIRKELNGIVKNKYDDAFLIVGLTNRILKARDMSFVFGETEICGKLSVISVGDNLGLDIHDKLKLITHEICHMYGMEHCKQHNCVINGFGSDYELHSMPMDLCSRCLKKLYVAKSFDLEKHKQNIVVK